MNIWEFAFARNTVKMAFLYLRASGDVVAICRYSRDRQRGKALKAPETKALSCFPLNTQN